MYRLRVLTAHTLQSARRVEAGALAALGEQSKGERRRRWVGV